MSVLRGNETPLDEKRYILRGLDELCGLDPFLIDNDSVLFLFDALATKYHKDAPQWLVQMLNYHVELVVSSLSSQQILSDQHKAEIADLENQLQHMGYADTA